MTSEELAAIRDRVGEAGECDLYVLSSYGEPGPDGYSPADEDEVYGDKRVRADINALLDEVARLTAEVERLEAMVPRWRRKRPGWVRLYVGSAPIPDSSLSELPGGPVFDLTTADEYPDLPTACRAVCARLGLPDILPPETP